MKPILPGSLCLETVMQMVDTCVCCGAPVPEGRQICWICEHTDYAKADEPVRLTPAPYSAAGEKTKRGIKNLFKRKARKIDDFIAHSEKSHEAFPRQLYQCK